MKWFSPKTLWYLYAGIIAVLAARVIYVASTTETGWETLRAQTREATIGGGRRTV